MSRQNQQRQAWCAGLSVGFALWLAGWAAGQETEPSKPAEQPAGAQVAPPATQPTTQPAREEFLRRIMERRGRAARERERKEEPTAQAQEGKPQLEAPPASAPVVEPPAVSPLHVGPGGPGSQPATRSLDELRARARSSAQAAQRGATPPGGAAEGEDDFVGPPYGPASPPIVRPGSNGHATRPSTDVQTRPSPAEEAKVPEPPVSKATDDMEWFNFDRTSWEDVIAYFVERIGKPLMMDPTELTIGGELTYKSDRKFTKDEAIDELNLILQMKGYRFVEQEHHVFLVPLSEMPIHVEPKEVFPSRAAFEAAGLHLTDYVVVFVQVKDYPVKKMQTTFDTMLPDYMTIFPMEESNQLKLVGMVQDIRKLLTLMDTVKLDPADPKEVRVFSVKTSARDVERLVREVVGIGTGARLQLKPDPATGRMVPVTTGEGEDVVLTADDRTNTIIVRATPAKLQEIGKYINMFAEPPDIGEFKTKVVRIQNANAADVADMLNKIFSQEQGAGTPAWQRLQQMQRMSRVQPGQPRQPQPQPPQAQPQPGATPEELLGEGIFERAKKTIRLAADERTNSLIVYANEEGQERVAQLLVDIDKAQPTNFKKVKLERADGSQIVGTVSQIAQGLGTTGRGRPPTVVLDEPNNEFLLLGDFEPMQQIEQIIHDLDVQAPEGQRHVVELVNVAPSRVAEWLRPMLITGAAGGGGAPVMRPGGFPRRGISVSPSAGPAATEGGDVQILPLDEAKLLIVVCSAEDWVKVEETIKLWDARAISNTPHLETFEVKRGDPQAIAATLSNLYRMYEHPTLGRSQVVIQPEGKTVLVYAVKPAIEEIAPLIEALDREDGNRLEILPLANADATQVAQQLQPLFGAMRGPRMGPGGAAGPAVVIQAEAVTNSLIVQADGPTLEKIKDFATSIDQKVGAQAPEQKFFTLRYAQPQEVAQAVATLYAGLTGGRGGMRAAAAGGASVKAVVSGAQVIVEAPHDKMTEIAAFITQLDDPKGNEIIIRTVKMGGADVTQIAAKLTAAFGAKAMKQAGVARFDADASSETILITCTKNMEEDVDRLLKEYEEAYAPITPLVQFCQLRYAQATDVAPWLGEQLITAMLQQNRNARQEIKVTAEARTNRVIINAPKAAVELAAGWLVQYDVPPTEAPIPPVETRSYVLIGRDVDTLARNLTQIFLNMPPRPDKLRAVFAADTSAEMLLVSAPKDMFVSIDEQISKFTADTTSLVPAEKFIAIKNADANYIAQQVKAAIDVKIGSRFGRSIAQKVNIGVDTRLNQIMIYAPQVAVEMAEALVAQLDVVQLDPQKLIQTIPLKNADATQLAQTLQQLLKDKLQQTRSLQITVEPMTNSLIVTGGKQDFEEIKRWAEELDTQALVIRGQPKIIDLLNANPYEVLNVLNAQYAATRPGQKNKLGQEITFAVVGGRSLLVQAPKDRLPEIEDLIGRLDAVGKIQVEVRTYELPGIGPAINDLARQVADAVNAQVQAREQKVSITAYPSADTLIVTARPDQFQQIEQMMDKFKALVERETTVTRFIELQYLNAANSANMIKDMLANKLSRGGKTGSKEMQNLYIAADPRTNRLIAYVPEKILVDLEEVVRQLDVEPRMNEGQVRTVPLAFADANTVATSLRPLFEQRANDRRNQDASQIVVRILPEPITNSLLVTASDEDFKQIEQKAVEIDEGAIVRKSEPELVKLQFADPPTVVSAVQSAFAPAKSQGRAANPQLEVSITPVGTTSVLVQAPKDKLDDVKKLIAQLDAGDTGESAPVTIELKYTDPNQMVQLINSMYAPKGQRNQQQDVQASVSNGVLVVKGPKHKIEQIRALVAEVDAEDKSGLQVKTYQLKVLNAAQVAAQVQLYLKSLGGAQRGGQLQPAAFPEPTTNTLVVLAPPDKFAFIDALVLKLESIDRPQSEAKTYVLKNARADQIAQNVDQMLKAKVIEQEGDARKNSVITAVFSDAATNRLFVFAPDKYQQLAGQLIKMVDEEVESGELVHIIQLQQADATQLAQVLQQVLPQGASGKGAAGGRPVRITADAGSNSLLLAGLPKDVAEIERHIEDLESKSEIVPELQIFQLQHSSAEDIAKTLGTLVGAGTKGGKGTAVDAVTITTDDAYNRLLVTANRRKMRHVEAFVEQLDVPKGLESGLADPFMRQLYFVDINRGDAFDIAWQVKDMLPDEKSGGPIIDADWFGKYIKVRCRTEEFDRILAMIREFEIRARVERKVVTVKPKGDLDAILAYLRERIPEDEIDIEYAPTKRPRGSLVETLWPEGEEPPSRQRQHEPEREKKPPEKSDQSRGTQGASSARVRPFELGLPVSVALLGDLDDVMFDDEPPPATRPSPGRSPAETPRKSGDTSAAPRAALTAPPAKPGGAAPAPSAAATTQSSPVEKEKTQVVVQPDGTVLIYGPESDVKDVEKVIGLIEEDLDVGEVIRIFEFRFGDVRAAAEVLNIMFNDVQRMNFPAGLLAAQQAAQRAAQPQPGQQRGERGRGQDGRDQQNPMLDQLRGMVGGGAEGERRTRDTSGQRVRITTDPGHNYLIVKCRETDLPEIRQLLRELDIEPGKVDLRVIQLKNLDATETAANIKEVLRISKLQQQQQQRGGQNAPVRGMMGVPGGPGMQQQLFLMLQEQMQVTVPGVEGGAKVERVEIVPDAVTNSLLVSAPPEVMKLIENVIDELEGLEGRVIVGIHHYPLKKAKVDDLLPLLQEVFSSAAGGGGGAGGGAGAGRGGRMGGGGRGVSPGALGPVTISGDPRSNTIIYTCEAKDVQSVQDQIELLDFEGAIAEAEMYVCQFGDATAIADMVETIYGRDSGSRGGGPAGRGNAPLSSQEVKIVADATLNTLIVWAPPDKRSLILAKVKELDELGKRGIREIDVANANPEELAAKLLEMFGGSGGGAAAGGGRGARGGRAPRAGATGGGPVVIIGDKNAKKLLVRAPDQVFRQIEEVVATLDIPNLQIQIRRFALEHADAEAVVESLKGALTEYLAMAGVGRGGEGLPFDPFTVVPDPRTNSVIVVGSQQTFMFVESVLATVDVEQPADRRKDFRVFVLDKADPELVAQAINDFAAGESAGTGGGGTRAPRTRGGGRGMPTGAAGGASIGTRLLDVYATGDPTTRTVVVFGKTEDIDVVENTIIAKYEDTLRNRIRFEEIAVQNLRPSEIVAVIWQFLGESETAAGPGGGGARGASGRAGAGQRSELQIIPNDNTRKIVVRGTQGDIESVKDLVARFDEKGALPEPYKVVKAPLGQDVTRLAATVESVVNDSEQEIADQTGRRARRITVQPDEYTKTLIVAGDPAMFGLVESIVSQLEGIKAERPVTRVIRLTNLSAADAQKMIEELQRRSPGAGGGSSSRTSGVRPSAPRSNPARPAGGTRPPTGGTRAPRPRGDLLWPHLRGLPEIPGSSEPAPGATPYVGVTMLRYAMGQAVVDRLLATAEEPPATRPQSGPPVELKPPPTRRAEPPRPRGTQPETKPAPPPEKPARAAVQPPVRPATKPAAAEKQPPAPPAARPATQEKPLPTAVEEAARAAREKMRGGAGDASAPPPATQPAESQPAELSAVTGELVGEVAVTPIDSKQIIITGDESDVAFIEQILMLMEGSASPALVEVFPITSAKATVLAPIIEKAIKARTEMMTPTPGPGDKFSIAAEARSNSLIVAASEKIMAQISELIEKLDVPKPEGTDFRAVALHYVRAAEAVAQLRPTIEKLNKMREVPTESQSSIEAVDRSNSVLIIGTPTDVEDIERLIKTIDVEIKPGDEQTSFVAADAILIQLQNGQAEDVAKVLNDMIKAEQEAATQGRTGDRGAAAGKAYVKIIRLRIGDRELPDLNLERPVRIIPDKGTNSLLIFSTPKNNEALTEIVKVFDTLPIGADTEVRAIALENASAEEVAKILKDTFEDKGPLKRPSDATGKGFAKGELPPVPPGLTGKGLPYVVGIQHDVRSNTVIVIGRKEAVLLAAGLIAQLDKPTEELGLKRYVIALRNMPASAAADKLTKAMDDRSKLLGADKNKARDSAVIAADERSNRLIVMASPEVYQMIEELASQLDAADPYRVVDLRFRRLQYADAQKLQGLIKEVFDRKQKAEKDQSKEAKDSLDLVADTRSNSLILTGTRDYLAEADEMLDKLDQKFDPTVVFRVRPVLLNSAANIAALLKDMVDKALKEQDSKLKGSPIHVAFDPITNSLLLAASQEDLVLLERWVEILDRPNEIGRMTRIIPLKRASAENVSKAASDLFKNVGSTGGGGTKGAGIDVTVTFDASSNAVVAFGPPAILEEVANFVRQLDDTESTTGTIVRIFKLNQADARDAGNLLTNILELRGGSVGGSTGGGTSGGGTGGSKEAAKQVILMWQKENPEHGPEWLRAVRSDIRVIADLRANSLVVTAPADSMPLMESLVAAVDVPPDAAKVRTFALRNADAEQMVKMLKELFQPTQTGGGRAGGAGGTSEQERTLSLGEGLGAAGGREEVSFTTDVRTNSVIAAGTKGYLDLVEELILQLDTIPIVDFKTTVYSPRNMVADDLAKALVEYSDKDKARLKELGKDISVAQQMEREIVAISHKESNRIILSYNPRVESDVFDVVRELDQPPPQVSIEVLIVEVTTGNKLELGVEFAFQDLQYAKAGPTDTTTFDYVGGTDVGAAGAGLGGFTFTITGRDFNFLLRTLQSEQSLKVLSRPHIVAMDNQEANIEITNSVPYVTGTQTTSAGQISTSVQREDVGIKLKVKPQINPDGLVRLEITQEVSDLTGSTIAVGQGLTAPIFFKRMAETVVTVHDNETVVLGGLIQQRDQKQEQKIPILGDIPLLGLMFRYQNDDESRSELLVILTPRVIRTIDDYREMSVQARDQTGLIPDEIKLNPLMRKLQLQPGETTAAKSGPESGPADETLRPNGRDEEYGPLQPAGNDAGEESGRVDPDSYDIPLRLLTRR